MADVHMAFLQQLCRLKGSVTLQMSRELAVKPCVHHRLRWSPACLQDSVHVEYLHCNTTAVQEHPSSGLAADKAKSME